MLFSLSALNFGQVLDFIKVFLRKLTNCLIVLKLFSLLEEGTLKNLKYLSF